MDNTILKKNKVGRFINLNFKSYYKATGIKGAWNWQKDRHIDQWKRIEGTERNPRLYGQLIFNKGASTIQQDKNGLFNNWCWDNLLYICKRMKLYLHSKIFKNQYPNVTATIYIIRGKHKRKFHFLDLAWILRGGIKTQAKSMSEIQKKNKFRLH